MTLNTVVLLNCGHHFLILGWAVVVKLLFQGSELQSRTFCQSLCNAWVGTKTKQTMPPCCFLLSSVKPGSIFDGAFTERRTPQCCVSVENLPTPLIGTYVPHQCWHSARDYEGDGILPKIIFDCVFIWWFSRPGWHHLPRIPRIPRASPDVPHVVHRDGQFHWFRWRSLGLLSCVSALLIWHNTHTHTHPPTKAFIVSLKNKGPFCGACDQLLRQFDYISLVGELLIRQELPLCLKPFSDFSGASAELNTVVFWNSEQCGNSKKSLCRCFLYPGNY